jgi:hypothetical protein
MIDMDNGPLAMLFNIFIVFFFPFLYSFFVDKCDKNMPPIDTYSK